MTAFATGEPIAAPRAVVLLPIAYLLHLAEEWFGGFTDWTLTVPVYDVGPERFVLINAIGLAVFLFGTGAALRYPRMAWFAASLAALLGLNGALHAMATLGFGSYSPGTLTGLVLYIPLSAIVLRKSAGQLPRSVFAGSAVFGVILHGLVAILASL